MKPKERAARERQRQAERANNRYLRELDALRESSRGGIYGVRATLSSTDYSYRLDLTLEVVAGGLEEVWVPTHVDPNTSPTTPRR